MGDPLTLNDYLPVIDHPEHGKAICKAAGVDLGKEDYITLFLDGVCFFGQKENLPTYIVAALSHGLLAWLAESAEVGGATALRSTHGGTKGWILSDCRSTVRSPTLPAAILAAAKRCMGVE